MLNEDYDTALKFADSSIRLRENNLALLYRARINLKLTNLEAARSDLIRSAEMGPGNSDVLCEQALLADQTSNDNNLANSLFLEIEKRDPNIWCLSGRVPQGVRAFWGEGESFSREQLLNLPLTSREQLRRYQEVRLNK